MTNVDPTKPPYFSNLAEGQKKTAPCNTMGVRRGYINRQNQDSPNEYKVKPKWMPFCTMGHDER